MGNALAALRAAREAEGRARMTHEAWAPPEELSRARKWLTGPVATDDYGNEIPNDSSSLLSMLNSLVPQPGQSEEQIIQNTAGVLLPSGGLGPLKELARGPVRETALRIFAGPGAKTADHNALGQAMKMAEGGADNETIRAATDWFQGPDEKWRFEIDDSGSKPLGPRSIAEAAELESGNNVQTNARAALLHPKLWETYPDAGKIGVTLDPKAGGTGTYWGGGQKVPNGLEQIRTSIDPDYSANRSLMLHELQHAVQEREGFARGGSPSLTEWASPTRRPQLLAQAKRSMNEWKPASIEKFWGDEPITAEAKKEYAAYLKQWKSPEGKAERWRAVQEGAPGAVYKRLAGEVEARDVQARMDYTPEQRKATAPYSSQGIAPEDMTINFLGGENKAITWHGSTHKFPPTERNALGEFDATKVNTGEGAQAYGHGMPYLAGNPTVAKEYAGMDGPSVMVNGKPLSEIADPNEQLYWQDYALKGREAAIEGLKKDVALYKKVTPEKYERYSGYLKKLESAKPADVSVSRGHLYKVDLPDEHIAKMLDWDKPLSEQPHIQSLFDLDEQGRVVLPNGERVPPGKLRGESLYRAVAEGLRPQAGDTATAKASEYLKSRGVPGLRYLDQGSRGAGQGTSNYVVFDPAITRILGRE